MDQVARLEIKAVSDDLVKATKRLDAVEKQGRKTEKTTTGLGSTFTKFAGTAVLVTAATTAMFSAMDNIRSAQKLDAMLKTATGSAQGARAAIAELGGISGQMPNTLEDLTRSFIKLENLGLNSSQNALLSYGETASAMGRELDQLIEAVADATVGEFERLKEFGIKAKSEGDNVSFTFRGVTTTVKKNASEIEDYLINLGNTQFAGSMAAQMETIDGQLSNLTDAWFKFTTSFEGVVASPAVGGLKLMADGLNSASLAIAAMKAPSLDKTTVEHLGLLKALRDDQEGRWLMFGEDKSDLEARIQLLEGIKSFYDEQNGLQDQVKFRSEGKEGLIELKEQRDEMFRLQDSAYAIEEINKKIVQEQKMINIGVSDWAARLTEIQKLEKERDKLIEKHGKAVTIGENRLQSFFDDARTELEILQDKHASELAYIIAHKDLLFATEEAYQQKRTELEAEHARERREIEASGLTGKLGSIKNFFDDLRIISQGENEKLFRIQRGFALADAVVSGAKAINMAWGSAKFPGNLKAVALTTAEQAANIATIKKTTFAGNYTGGGIVPGNSMYGDNLSAGVNSRELILNLPQQKRLFDIANGSGQGGLKSSCNWTIQINNNNRSNIHTEVDDRTNTIKIAVDAVESRFVSGIAQGNSKAAKTMEGVYGLRRGGR